MPDTIKQRIALDGDADVKKSLADIGDVGEKSFKKIDDASKQASASIGALQKDRLARIGISPEEFQKRTEAFKAQSSQAPPRSAPGRAGIPVESGEGSDGIRRLREVLHTLHPVLAEAGIGFGELSGFMIAARGGAVALAASIGGALVTALQKAGDTANDAAARLGAFTGSTEKGRESFDQLKGSAEQLRVPTSDLTAPFEQLLRANQSSPAGTQASDKTLQDTLATFVKASQADRTDFDKAIAGITEFFAGLKETGNLTPDAIAKLADEVSPTLAKQLLDDLTSRLPGKQTYSTQDVVQSTANVAPQVNQNLFKAAADAADGISTSWVHFKAAIERLEEAIGGGSPVASVLNEVSEEIDAIATALKKIREYAKEKFGSGESNPIALGGLGTKLHDAVVGPADTGPTGPGTAERGTQLNYAFRDVAGTTAQLKAGIATTAPDGSESWAPAVDALASASEKAAQQVEGHGQAAEGAQTSLNKFAEGANKLQIIGSELSKRQSEIDLKFQPKEAASVLAKDQISVQNADIHLQQAKISGLEAQKNREIANLAPEAANNSVRDAQLNRDTALSRFFASRGVDTLQLDQLNQGQAESNALADADTALKRAKIEQKYAYLEPKKAELNAQQTETAIRSAEIEKNDASLKLAKDSEGAPIAHDLAQLRYAQASLDEAKLTNKYGEETVKTLEQILDALTKDADKRDTKSEPQSSREKPTDAAGKIGDAAKTMGEAAKQIAGASGFEKQSSEAGLHTVAGDRVAREEQARGPSLPEPSLQDLETKSGTKFDTQSYGSEAKRQELLARDAYAREHPGELQTNQEGEALNDTALAGFGLHPRDQYDQNKMLEDQKFISEWERQQQGQFGKNIADQAGDQKSFDRNTYAPAQLGHYDENGSFVPAQAQPDSYTGGAPHELSFPQYNESLRRDVFPQGGVPLPQPRPPEADAQSSTPQPQQFADLSEAVSKIVDAISAKLNEATAKPVDQTGPTENLGIRGESGAEDASKDVADLGDKAGDAANGLGALVGALSDASSKIESDADTPTTHAAGGGLITGPGTSTSDSIPAMLSHKEYVLDAKTVERVGVPYLDGLRAGKSPGHYAIGGEAGASLKDRLASLGISSNINVPHLAVGGMPHFAAAQLSKSVSEAAGPGPLHPVSVTFPWGSRVDGLHAEPGAVEQLRRAGIEGQTFSTGKKPSWYGGRG